MRWIDIVWGILYLILLGLIFAIRKWLETKVESSVNSKFLKEQEKYKHDLSLITEAARFEYQRRLQDFNLFSQKKHDIAARLYELLKVAEGAICGIYGLRWAPTFQECNREDIDKFMIQKNIASGIRQSILELWDKDKDKAIDSLKKQMLIAEKNDADSSFTEAKNYFVINELYLSDETVEATQKVIVSLGKYLVYLKILSNRPSVDISRLEEEIKLTLEDLRPKLKKEISSA